MAKFIPHWKKKQKIDVIHIEFIHLKKNIFFKSINNYFQIFISSIFEKKKKNV